MYVIHHFLHNKPYRNADGEVVLFTNKKLASEFWQDNPAACSFTVPVWSPAYEVREEHGDNVSFA